MSRRQKPGQQPAADDQAAAPAEPEQTQAERDAEFDAAAPDEGEAEAGDEESADAAADERLADELPAFDLNAATLTGDVRDWILARLRHEQDKRPWDERSEAQQRETLEGAERQAMYLVRKIVDLVAARGFPVIRGTLSQITVKDGFKAVIEIGKAEEQRHALVDAQGSIVHMLVADLEDFTGERNPVRITPDQNPLPLA